MKKIWQTFFSMKWKITPTVITVFLFLVSVQFIGQFDPHYAIRNEAHPNLIREISVRPGDSGSWSGEGIEEDDGWTSVAYQDLPSLFDHEIFWARSTFEIKRQDMKGLNPVIFMAGYYTAEVFLNGVFVGKKGGITKSQNQANPAPYSQYIEIDANLFKDGKNVLAFRIQPAKASLLIGPKLQAISLNLLEYSQANVMFYYFVLAYLLLFTILFMGVFLISYRRRISDKKKTIVRLLGSFFLLLNIFLILLWFALGQLISLTDTMLFLYCTTMVGVFSSFLLLLKNHLYSPRKNSIIVALFVTVSILSLFAKKDFPSVILTLQYIFCGFIFWKVFVHRALKLLPNADYLFGFAGYLLLIFYQPIFMASFGIYIFASGAVVALTVREALAILEKNSFKSKKQYLAIYSKGKKILLNIEEIQVLAAVRNYTEVVLTNGERHIYHKGLAQLLKKLPGNFMRVHRSYAVNLNHVRQLLSSPGSRYELALKTGNNVSVGRKHLPAIKERLI